MDKVAIILCIMLGFICLLLDVEISRLKDELYEQLSYMRARIDKQTQEYESRLNDAVKLVLEVVEEREDDLK